MCILRRAGSAYAVVASSLFIAATPALGQRDSRRDSYGDPLPPGAVLRLGTTRLQTRGGFAWTPDGKSLVTMKRGSVSVWDIADGHCRETLLVPITVDPFYTYGSQLALSRDGQRLVCTDFYGTIAVWNLETSEMISQPAISTRDHTENAALAIAPDGRTFVTLRNSGELQVRDMATCEVVRTITLPEEHWREGTPAVFSPDGRTLAVGSSRSRSIYLLNLDKVGEPTVIKRAHDEWLLQLLFLADGRLVSVGATKGEAGKRGSGKDQIRFWNVSEARMTQEWALGDSLPSGYGVAFSADGQTMVSVSRDQLAIWDAKTQSIIRKVTGLNIRNPSSATVAIDPLGKYVAVDDRDNYVRIWELATGRPHLTTDRHHQDHVRGTWSPDGATIATGDGRGDIRIWNAGSGTLVKHVPRGPSWGISALRYVEGGKQLLLCGDEPDGEDAKGPVQWLDAISGERLREQVLDTRTRLATPSPDQSLIAVGTEPGPEPGMRERSVRLLDGRSGQVRGKVAIGGRWLVALGWSDDGKELLAAAGGKVLRAPIDNLDAVSETELPHVQRDQHGDLVPSQFFRAIFLNGGQRIVTAGGLPEVFCWNLLASEREWSCPLPDRNIRGFALSPDERMLACLVGVERKGNSLRLVDLSARREIAHYDLGLENCESLAFSPDGRRVLVGFYDGTALVYDISEARELLRGE